VRANEREKPGERAMSLHSRRSVTAAIGAALAAPFLNLGTHRIFAATTTTYSTRAIDLMRRSVVIDMLSPLTLNPTPAFWGNRLSEEQAADFRSSGITALHNSVGYRSLQPYDDILAWLAEWNGFLARNDDLFIIVNHVDDIDRAKATGKIAVIQGLQNSEHFRTPADVKLFYDIGQRCSQLTYNWQTLIGSGSTEREDGGVSDFGVSIVQEMNRVGMLVDVSHCGDRTTLDGIDISTKPIAITHANCRALNSHPRGKTDEAIKKLAAKGGVMGISGVRMFVTAQEPTTIDNIVDHIDHVVKLVGIEAVGVGSDADLYGYDKLPPDQIARLKAANKASYRIREKSDIEGFNHPTKMFDLTEALIRRGYSNDNIEMILGKNFRRLLGEV
jgi:membrane dipeptidase